MPRSGIVPGLEGALLARLLLTRAGYSAELSPATSAWKRG